MVQVHHHRNVRVQLQGSLHQMAQVGVVSVLAGAFGGLDYYGGVGLLGGHHDRLDLLHVVDVQRGHAISVLGRVI